ncbi:MAG: hypothetical protein LBR80_05215 [Deltaproteobacteria bacterium]|nr:hypothetical protein [Deltaproteobacteria bacterium]
MTDHTLETFVSKAAGARAACEARAEGPVAALGPPSDGCERCLPALSEAVDALEALHGAMAVFESPVDYSQGILDLMKAYAWEGRLEKVEELFHRLPRFPRSPELDDRLSEGAMVFSMAALAAGDLPTAEQCCRDGFPDVTGYLHGARRLEAAVLIIARRLSDGDYDAAAAFFMPFVPGVRNPSWAPRPVIGESPEERDARQGFLRRLADAAGALFDHCERRQLFVEMTELYEALERLENSDAVLDLRLLKAASLVRLAVETGRLSEAVRYYGALSSLSHLDDSGELMSRMLMLLTEAYRDTGDESAAQRLISGA